MKFDKKEAEFSKSFYYLNRFYFVNSQFRKFGFGISNSRNSCIQRNSIEVKKMRAGINEAPLPYLQWHKTV